jgi:hypothetical protein
MYLPSFQGGDSRHCCLMFVLQRWALALFSRFCTFALASTKQNKERERKKMQIRVLSSPHNGNPVSEPKAALQGEKQGS